MGLKESYWKYSLIAVILGLGLLLFLKMTPFMGGVLGAFTLYIMMRGQMRWLTRHSRMRRSLAAALLLAEAILCFLVPLTLVVWLAVDKLQYMNVDIRVITDIVTTLSHWLRGKIGYDLLGPDNVSAITSAIPAIGQFLMGSISSFVVNLFALVFILYFMLVGGTRMEQYVRELMPFSEQNKREVLHEVNVIVRSNAIGIPLLALIQGGIALLGYWLFGAPSVLLFGCLTSFATVIPLVGTALVWVPLALYMGVSGSWPHAVGLMLYCGLLVTNVDNLIRFILQKKMADIHPLVTIFGVIIGLSLFGFMGVIFGPLLISLFLLCTNIFKEQYLGDAVSGRLLSQERM